MSLFSSLLILCSIVFLSNGADKKCLSFSGGGIRAAMGAYRTMRAIEDAKKLGEIKCISMISGGSWGFILWLYEDTKDASNNNIIKHIRTTKGHKWGPRGPNDHKYFEIKPKLKYLNPFNFKLVSNHHWYENWGHEIQTNILEMTSLKGKSYPKFVGDIRERLNSRGLKEADIYFVVERVSPVKKDKNKFIDYCWFRNKPLGFYLMSKPTNVDMFECSQTVTEESYYDMKIRIKDGTDAMRDVTLLDVLDYCSSAWATKAGWVNAHKHHTREFHATKSGEADSDVFRLVDAGGTFNDPLIPYMVKRHFVMSTFVWSGFQIWDFDFTKYGKKQTMLKQLKKAMDKIGKPIDGEEEHITRGISARAEYRYKLNDRLIVHCPMFGYTIGDKFKQYFPTLVKRAWPKRWDMEDFFFFYSQWDPHMNELLRDF